MTDRIFAFRSVHPDGRSSHGFTWPLTPGAIVEASGPFTGRPNDGCPAHEGDGICIAHTAAGMASGAIPAITVLVCSYDPADLLGTELDGSKVRVKRCRVESVHDFPGVLRGADGAMGHECLPTKADLSSANLRSANLSSADLRSANLSSANLRSANLSSADLRSANLDGAELEGACLRGAFADAYTIWPDGFDPIAAGVAVR